MKLKERMINGQQSNRVPLQNSISTSKSHGVAVSFFFLSFFGLINCHISAQNGISIDRKIIV